MSEPLAQHLGVDDIPFIDIGDGSLLRVLQVKTGEGLWIIENIFQAGYEVETHRHTGPVYGYTTSGAWKYKEYDYLNRAGSFLYEPAGSVHTLQCIEDNTRVWFQMVGSNINLDAEGNITSVIDGPLSWWEKLRLRQFPQLEVIFLGAVFQESSQQRREALLPQPAPSLVLSPGSP